MKLKLKQLNPNPFKKQIDGGKLNKEQIAKLKSSIKELGLMGSIPVVKIKNKYHLISHHHRLQALKEVYGKEKEIEITIHNYSNDDLLRGMVMENLTQRNDEFKEVVQNLKCVRDYLKKNVAVQTLNNQNNNPRPQNQPEAGSISHISSWLNKQGEIICRGSISEHLQVADNLSPKLYAKVEKTHSGDADRRTNGEVISKSQAIMLARLKDKKEQEDLAKALHKSRENRVRNQSHLITEYKKAKPEIQEAVRTGKKDIADVSVPIVFKPRLKSAFEKNMDYSEQLSNLNTKNWKEAVKHLSLIELETLYTLLIHWCHEDLTPLIKEIIKQTALKKNITEEFVFEINTNLKGGKNDL